MMMMMMMMMIKQGLEERSFGIGNRHFERNPQGPGRARPLNVTSSLPRDFVLGSVSVYSRSWLIFSLTVLNQNVFLILRIAKTKK